MLECGKRSNLNNLLKKKPELVPEDLASYGDRDDLDMIFWNTHCPEMR